MRKLVCVLAILGLAGMASGTEHWRGGGWGGDGTTWHDALNWDDSVPSATTWDANKLGEEGTPKNHDIHIRSTGTCGSGTIYSQSGYTVNLTVEQGVTMTNSGYLYYNSAGQFTVKSNATYDMKYGELKLESSNLTVTVEEDGLLYCSTLRHNNGAKMDVYGDLRAWTVSRISGEGTYRLNVYNGGMFQVDNSVPSGGWSENGKVTVFVCGTVKLIGDHRAEADYLAKVQKGEDGDWDVWMDGGYTYIHLTPEPTSLLLLGLGGLVLLRRRR